MRFTAEAGQVFRVSGEDLGKDFDRDIVIEADIAGPVDLSHAARAQLADIR